jgi:hypothetical protein
MSNPSPTCRLVRGFVEEEFSDLGSLAQRIVELAGDGEITLVDGVGSKIWERTGEGTVTGVSVHMASEVCFAVFTPDARLGSFGHRESLSTAIRRRKPSLMSTARARRAA